MKKKLFYIIFSLLALCVNGQVKLTITAVDSLTGVRIPGVDISVSGLTSSKATLDDGKAIFVNDGSSGQLIKGQDIIIRAFNPLYKPFVKYHRIGNDDGKNDLVFLLQPITENDTFIIYGFVTDEQSTPLNGIKVSISDISSFTTSAEGYFELSVSKREILPRFQAGIPLIFGSENYNYFSNYTLPLINNKFSYLVPQQILKKEAEVVRQTKLVVFPPKHYKNDIKVTIVQNNLDLDIKKIHIDAVTIISLPENLDQNQKFEILLSGNGLVEKSIPVNNLSELNPVYQETMIADIGSSIWNLFLHGSFPNGYQISGGSFYNAPWINNRIAIGFEIGYASINNISIAYNVFEDIAVERDTTLTGIYGAVFGRCYWLDESVSKKNIFGEIKLGAGDHIQLAGFSVGGQFHLTNKLCVEAGADLPAIYFIQKPDIIFNYYGNAHQSSERTAATRINFSLKIVYLLR